MEHNKNLENSIPPSVECNCHYLNSTLFGRYKSKKEDFLNSNNISDILFGLKNDSKLYFRKCIPLVNFLETYQGEGPNCGRKMVLTRFKYCNKSCPFCDTQKFTKDIEPEMVSLKDIELKLQSSPNLMITGGEPTIMQHMVDTNCSAEDCYIPTQFECTIMMASVLNYGFLDIETNGLNLYPLCEMCDTIMHRYNKNINISWSPKFVFKDDYTKNIDNLYMLTNYGKFEYCKPIIKIVIGEDLEEYKNFIYQAIYHYKFDNNRVYLMPKGTTLDEINESMKLVMEVGSDLKCNVSSRLHILHNFK